MPASGGEPRVTAETTEDRIRRIAFVTLRFHELKGLLPATFGGALIVAILVEHAAGTVWRSTFSMVQPLILANCVYVLTAATLERGYRDTFGDAVATRLQRLQSGLFALIVLSGAMIDAFVPLSGPHPSVMAVGCACYATWIVLRDWRWRIHYLPVVVAGVAASVVTASLPAGSSVWPNTDPVRAEGDLLACTLIGLGLVWAGMCDHRLLAASLGGGAGVAQRRETPIGMRSHTTSVVLVAGVAALGSAVMLVSDSRDAALILPGISGSC